MAFRIAGRSLSADQPAYVIAEIGVNHNGDLALAHRMVDAAKAAGADAVKFQTYRTQDLVSEGAAQAAYQKSSVGDIGQAAMLRQLELPFSAFAALRRHCDDVGIDFISTAFDPESLDFVISLSPACLKWPSGEITNWPLLRQAARAELPVLLSTGMATLGEIGGAIAQLGSAPQVAILQCVSNYPARLEDQNLRTLPRLAARFGAPVGFSDHTLGPAAMIAARALGMCVWEKHFTLDRAMAGPDHAASSEPAEFADMVALLRQVEAGLGDGEKRPLPQEEEVRSVARKSLFYAADLPAGHTLRDGDLVARRPASGIAPDRIDEALGQVLARPVQGGTPFAHGDVAC